MYLQQWHVCISKCFFLTPLYKALAPGFETPATDIQWQAFLPVGGVAVDAGAPQPDLWWLDGN